MPINAEGRYGHLIMQECILPPSHSPAKIVSEYERFGKRIHWIDGSNIPGAFQMNTSWWYKPNRELVLANPKSQVACPHTHEYSEILGFYGSNPDKPDDLGGEVELHIDGEPYILTKSTMVFLPGGLPHCPLYINRVDRPIFHFSVVMNSMYTLQREE